MTPKPTPPNISQAQADAAFDAARAATIKLFEEFNAARIAVCDSGTPELSQQLDVITLSVFETGLRVLKAQLHPVGLLMLEQLVARETRRAVAVAIAPREAGGRPA
jgi:hypothetical protein